MHAHSFFARTSHMLSYPYLGFATHTCTHIQAQKHTYEHTHEHLCTRVLKSRTTERLESQLRRQIIPALPSASGSIMLVFHKITKARFACRFSYPALPRILKARFTGKVGPTLPSVLSSTLRVFHNIAKVSFRVNS